MQTQKWVPFIESRIGAGRLGGWGQLLRRGDGDEDDDEEDEKEEETDDRGGTTATVEDSVRQP